MVANAANNSAESVLQRMIFLLVTFLTGSFRGAPPDQGRGRLRREPGTHEHRSPSRTPLTVAVDPGFPRFARARDDEFIDTNPSTSRGVPSPQRIMPALRGKNRLSSGMQMISISPIRSAIRYGQ